MIPLLPCARRGSRPVPRAARTAAIVLFVLASAAGCKPGGAKGGGFTMPPVPVEVSDVTPRLVREQFRALGSIDADESVQIVSEVSGVVRALPFREGAPIGAGALLAQIDDRTVRAEANRAVAQEQLARTQAERAERLFKDDLLAQSQLDDARTALQVAQANAAAAKVAVDKAQIRAPFAGVVGRRRISPGAYVRAGDVITEVARTQVMKVRFAAPERELEHLGRGHAVEVTTPAVPGRSFAGEITVVDPIIDPQTRTVQIVARVANPHGLLQAGMSGNVAVTLAEHPNALTVPDEAVFAEGAQSFVFVVQPDSTVQRAAIGLGIRDSSQVEVVDGLQAGARIVRTGHQKLFPGAKVMPMLDGGPAAAAPGAGGAGGASAAKAPDPPKATRAGGATKR
jgi:membrane fusion protein (multidrug efflux system)